MSDSINVEVVFALPDRQLLVEVSLPPQSTIADAIDQSGLQRRFPDFDLSALETGIWGRATPRGQIVQSGDRVEIYRPLQQDPREARRELAENQSLGSSD